MSKALNLTGQRFGKLTAINPTNERQKAHILWNCVCDCGTQTTVRSGSLHSGAVKSCGCLQRQIAQQTIIKRCKTHGHSHRGCRSVEYRAWRNMKQRCYNPNCKHYKNYGGRGITVCPEWQTSFQNFFTDMGPKPSTNLTLERVNNDAGYSPNNCVWATRKEQIANRRRRGKQLK